jgi:electron transfer DM13
VPPSRTLTSGRFRSYEHATSGVARVIELADGRRYIRFEHFRTSNGPLLKVYISAAPASGPSGSFDDTFIDLGNLKSNIGEQNYEIARDVDLTRFPSVVIWCERFGVAFGAAPL